MRSNWRFFLLIAGGILLSVICAVLLFLLSGRPNASAFPSPGVAQTEFIPTFSPTDPPAVTAVPALNEARQLTLEYPLKIRAGDSDLVRLTLEVDENGNLTPTAQFDDHVVTGEPVQIPDLYDTHRVVAEARFDIAGMDTVPPDLISIPLARSQTATFSWSVRPAEAGIYRGTVWLYLRFVDKVSGEENRSTLSAQIVQIEATSFLNLSGNAARLVGVAGTVVGTIVGIPFFEDIAKYIWNRRKKQPEPK